MSYPNIFDLRLIREAPPVTKILLILFITFSSFLIIGFIFILLSVPLFHLNLNDLNMILKGKGIFNDIRLIKYYQATQSIALFIIPSIFLNYCMFSKSKNLFHTGRIPSYSYLIIILLLTIIMMPVIDELMRLNELIPFPVTVENKFQNLEKEAGEITDKLLTGSSFSDLFINICVIAIIPAIGEEFFFRGIIQQVFEDWFRNGHLAVIMGAIIFSGIHLQFFGFIPRMMLGILFGYIFFWSRNIWLPVVGHFLNNSITVIIQYFEANKLAKMKDFNLLNTLNGNNILTISVILTIVLIIVIRKICLHKTIKQHL
jgi:uncharacterized protein